MSEDMLSSAINAFRNSLNARALPTEDNAHKMIEGKEKKDNANKQSVLAGINKPFGIDGTPMISPKLSLGVSYFAFMPQNMQMPKELRDKINIHARVERISDDYNNNGFGIVTGISKYASVFYIKSLKAYSGASVGGLSILGSDPHKTYLSVVHGQEGYDYTPDPTVPSQSSASPHIDADSTHAIFNIGSGNYSIGASYARHTAMIDDVNIGHTDEWQVLGEVEDLERIFASKDTDFSLGLGAAANNKGDITLRLDSGIISLMFKLERGKNFKCTPFIQGGLAF